MNFSEAITWMSELRISNEMALLVFFGVSIGGLMFFLAQLTREIPRRLLIVVPIPLYLLTGVIAAIVYIYRH